ncbi:hypothetical protein D3C71_1403510 [compost metagenome]
MALVASGADEFVELHAERGGQVPEAGGIGADEVGDANTRRFGGTHVLEAVVVGASLQEDLTARQPAVPGDGVRQHEFEREPDMGVGVHVGDGGGDIVGVVGHVGFLSRDCGRGGSRTKKNRLSGGRWWEVNTRRRPR